MQNNQKSSIETLKEIGQCLLFVSLCIGSFYFLTCEDRTYHVHLGVSLAIWAYGVAMHIASPKGGLEINSVTEENLSHENIW